MTVIFNQQSSGLAVLVQGDASGWLVAQGLAPFYIGQSRQALENKLATPPGGFNQEIRDGIYVDPAKVPGGILWLPWNGDIWILNGTGTNDNPNNVVTVEVLGCS